MEDFSWKMVARRLWELPEQVRNAEQDILNLSMDLERADLALSELKSSVFADVEAQVGNDGKKVFSNAEKRELETERRLGLNAGAGELRAKIEALKKAKSEKLVVCEFHKRLFRAAESLAGMNGRIE